MSTCISRHGEYSDHEVTNPEQPFMCQRCFVFDEDAAMAEVVALRTRVALVQAVVHSSEADKYRDEACRGCVELPYASNRYVRLLDDVRTAVAASEAAR